MLPDRATLKTWHPERLLPIQTSLNDFADAIDGSAWEVIWKISKLDSLRLWTGKRQTAAIEAAERAQLAVGALRSACCCGGVEIFAPTIVKEKGAIDSLVETIESGQLYVTNDWSVLVRPEKVAPEMANLLALMANGFQDRLNSHLSSLSKADYALGARLQSGPANSDMGVAPPELADTRNMVLDPFSKEGRERQRQRLTEHMIGTVVGVETVRRDGKTVRTVDFLDGSKQVYTKFDRVHGNDLGTLDYYSSDGRLATVVTQHANGKSTMKLMREGLEPVTVETDIDGGSVGHVDGRQFELPSNDFFTHPELTLAGGGLSALEVKSAKGFPLMTIAQSENLRLGSRIAGPALGIATTIYHVASAESKYDACVAGFSGVSGTLGSYALGSVGGTYGPGTAAAGAIIGAWGGGYIGSLLGERVCVS